jgi:hypothetical protein
MSARTVQPTTAALVMSQANFTHPNATITLGKTRRADTARGAGMSSLDTLWASTETLSPDVRDEQIPGELVYEYALQITRVVEYGMSADALLAGQASPPPEGARVDFYLEGLVAGPRLKGIVNGVDYLYFRADGRAQLHIHAEITTEGGKKIALVADGIAIPEQGTSIFRLRENVTLLSHHLEFSWVNAIQIWASGKVDVQSGRVRIKAYTA